MKATLKQINFILMATRFDPEPLIYEEVSQWSKRQAWEWINKKYQEGEEVKKRWTTRN